jgi:GNAT superfamily N-acetyltransferase
VRTVGGLAKALPDDQRDTPMTITQLHISLEPEATETDKDAVRDPLNERNMVITGFRDYRPLNIFLRDENGTIHGGLLGDIWAHWLHISYLFVAEELRGQDHGTRLLELAEQEARTAGCRHVHLETFDFQAPGFYARFGYEVFAELPGYTEGHTFYYLRKTL